MNKKLHRKYSPKFPLNSAILLPSALTTLMLTELGRSRGEECKGRPARPSRQASRLRLRCGLLLPVCSRCPSPIGGCKGKPAANDFKQMPGGPALPAPRMTLQLSVCRGSSSISQEIQFSHLETSSLYKRSHSI